MFGPGAQLHESPAMRLQKPLGHVVLVLAGLRLSTKFFSSRAKASKAYTVPVVAPDPGAIPKGSPPLATYTQQKEATTNLEDSGYVGSDKRPSHYAVPSAHPNPNSRRIDFDVWVLHQARQPQNERRILSPESALCPWGYPRRACVLPCWKEGSLAVPRHVESTTLGLGGPARQHHPAPPSTQASLPKGEGQQAQVLLFVYLSVCLSASASSLFPPRLGEKSAVERGPSHTQVFPHPHKPKAGESHGKRYSEGSQKTDRPMPRRGHPLTTTPGQVPVRLLDWTLSLPPTPCQDACGCFFFSFCSALQKGTLGHATGGGVGRVGRFGGCCW